VYRIVQEALTDALKHTVAQDGPKPSAWPEKLNPDVILMDVRTTGVHGLEPCHHLDHRTGSSA
jgi:CheY-like chemotaxis protein